MNNCCDCDCVHRMGIYCALFDDVVGFENCIFKRDDPDE